LGQSFLGYNIFQNNEILNRIILNKLIECKGTSYILERKNIIEKLSFHDIT